MFMPHSPAYSPLRLRQNPCYGSRLRLHPNDNTGSPQNSFTYLRNIFVKKCHELYSGWTGGILVLAAFALALPGLGQELKNRAPRPGAPEKDWVNVNAKDQLVEGHWRHLRGEVRIETSDELLTADEVDYNEDTGDATARGHVHFEHYTNGDKLDCDHAEYNYNSETGKFYLVKGTSPAKIQTRPGILTSSNPFYFEGQWAERLETKYILHDGFITDCKMPNP